MNLKFDWLCLCAGLILIYFQHNMIGYAFVGFSVGYGIKEELERLRFLFNAKSLIYNRR